MKLYITTIFGIFLTLCLIHHNNESFVSSYEMISIPKRTTLNGSFSPLKTSANTNMKFAMSKVPDISPLERVMITREGNLQQLFSAYYDETVYVKVDWFNRMKAKTFVPTPLIGMQYPVDQSTVLASWNRQVTMSIMSHNFCKATSIVRAHSPEVAKLLSNEAIGFGQLYKLLDVRPSFMLHDAGRNPDGGLWRVYSLHCEGLVTCDIREDFSPEASKWCIGERK